MLRHKKCHSAINALAKNGDDDQDSAESDSECETVETELMITYVDENAMPVCNIFEVLESPFVEDE